MYSKIALASSTRVFQRRVSSSSTCIRDQNASIIALSQQSPTDPIEGSSPDFRARSVNVQAVNWLPWTLSCLSSADVGGELVVDLAGDVALEAADDLALGEAF